MAIVSQGYFLTVTLVDAAMDAATLTYDLKATAPEDVTTAVTAILTALGNVTRAAVKSYTVSQRFVENALTLPAGVNIEERGTIVVQLASAPNKTAILNVPAPRNMFAAETGPTANDIIATTQLNNYVNLFKSAGPCTISDGETVTTFLRGRRTHRASAYG